MFLNTGECSGILLRTMLQVLHVAAVLQRLLGKSKNIPRAGNLRCPWAKQRPEPKTWRKQHMVPVRQCCLTMHTVHISKRCTENPGHKCHKTKITLASTNFGHLATQSQGTTQHRKRNRSEPPQKCTARMVGAKKKMETMPRAGETRRLFGQGTRSMQTMRCLDGRHTKVWGCVCVGATCSNCEGQLLVFASGAMQGWSGNPRSGLRKIPAGPPTALLLVCEMQKSPPAAQFLPIAPATHTPGSKGQTGDRWMNIQNGLLTLNPIADGVGGLGQKRCHAGALRQVSPPNNTCRTCTASSAP
jgi:hypothetical protein